MTQNTNQNSIKITKTSCDFEKTLLKNSLNILRETIDLIVSEDFDIDNPKNIATVVVNLTIIETNLNNAISCLENL
jgi:hypothetical protein